MSSLPTLCKDCQQHEYSLHLQGLRPATSLPFSHRSWEYLKTLLWFFTRKSLTEVEFKGGPSCVWLVPQTSVLFL